MNSKAIKRQLLAAIAMVLVAALALGSSTYAWFVASGSVTAEGMTVNALSEGGLAISFGRQAWGITATASDADKSLTPASTANLTNWYHAMAAETDSHVADDSTRKEISNTIYTTGQETYNQNYGYSTASTNGSVLAKTFSIRSTGSDTALSNGLYVKAINVTYNDVAVQMHTALRVGFVVHSVNDVGIQAGPFIYAPVTLTPASDSGNTPTDGYDVYRQPTEQELQADNTLTKVSVGTVNLKSVNTPSDPLLTGTIPNNTNNPVDVTVLIWFEGEDENLTSDKYDATDLDITIEFSSISVGTSNG